MILTKEEYDVLDKLAVNSKMDCWFTIMQQLDLNGELTDCVYDAENDEILSLEEGVGQLLEGCIDINFERLNSSELSTLKQLADKLNLSMC